MCRGICWLGALLLIGVPTSRCIAQVPAKAAIARKAKDATALVVVNGTFKQGTAFCIQETGFFLTNQHVVAAAANVKLVLNPGRKDARVVVARVIRTDKALDLALLKVEEKATYRSLPLGSSESLTELTEVIAVGFPFGTALSSEKGEYPAVSVNLGRITSLRMKKGELQRIQMDAAVNPGNSGGPLLDTQGRVLGVVVSGVRGTAVNFAIPVSHVQRFVAAPQVEVLPPTIAYVDRYQPAEFAVRIVSLLPRKAGYDVVLRRAKGQTKRASAETGRWRLSNSGDISVACSGSEGEAHFRGWSYRRLREGLLFQGGGAKKSNSATCARSAFLRRPRQC